MIPANDEIEYLLPHFCDWGDCTKQAIMRRWFREAGVREYHLCGEHAETFSDLLQRARQHQATDREASL